MTATLSPARRPATRSRSARRGAQHAQPSPQPHARSACRAGDRAGKVLAGYVDAGGRPREIVRCEGVDGSRLVIDRDAPTCADRRLLAQLAPEEPDANAELLCRLYLRDRLAGRCRKVTVQDLRAPALSELQGQLAEARALVDDATAAEHLGVCGNRYRLLPMPTRAARSELRWCRSSPSASSHPEPASLRDVIGATEGYEPIRAQTVAAIGRHLEDGAVSVATLISELARLNASRVVLNRRLRETVLATVEATELSMSEIALRCDRVKRDRRGVVSGETTWLARRLGLVCEGGASRPSPWVHSDVLALIARQGLGIAPREVEMT